MKLRRSKDLDTKRRQPKCIERAYSLRRTPRWVQPDDGSVASGPGELGAERSPGPQGSHGPHEAWGAQLGKGRDELLLVNLLAGVHGAAQRAKVVIAQRCGCGARLCGEALLTEPVARYIADHHLYPTP